MIEEYNSFSFSPLFANHQGKMECPWKVDSVELDFLPHTKQLFQIWKVYQNPHNISINLIYGRSLYLKFWRYSFNFEHTNSYYTPNLRECFEDSAELYCFLIAATELELYAREPVHFFIALPLNIHLHFWSRPIFWRGWCFWYFLN